MRGALAGLKVLDFSTLLPGPMATLLLAEAGAEVVKIERPGAGDEIRAYAPRWGASSASFAMLNRGKKSLALDLKSKDAVSRLTPLIESADVLVEQFRPGVMDRLGLGYAAVARINPRIIYCSITGYGQSGPKRDAAGHDLNYIGDAGLLSLGMGPAGAPVVPPALIADIAGGAYPAVLNILLGLRQRDSTGAGSHIDIAMSESVLPFCYWALGAGQAGGRWPGSGDNLVTGGTARYRLYPTKDGRVMAVAAIEQRFWDVFTDAIGLEAGRRDDAKDPAATIAAVARIVAGRTARQWRPILAMADCCCSIVATMEEARSDPHFAARGLFSATLANEAGQSMSALPVPVAPQFRSSKDGVLASPKVGADNDDLGF